MQHLSQILRKQVRVQLLWIQRDGFTALGKRQLKQIVDANKSIKIKPIIKRGKRHKVLAKMVDDGIGDTLILGPFRSYLSRLFTGSEVERILEYESSHALS